MNVPDFMPVLSGGSHSSPKNGACVMEYVSVLAGEPWTDRPKCTHPALATLAINVNDRLEDGERQVLAPLIPRLIGTASDDPHINIALAVFLLRKTFGVVWPSWAAEMLPAWDVLDRWARHDESVTVDDLCIAAAATAATAATAAAAAATAAATAATAAAATAATAAATAAAAAAAATTAAAAAAATTAAATAATTAATATAAFAYRGYRLDLLSILTGALDVYDEVSGRTPSDLDVQQWRDLAAVVA